MSSGLTAAFYSTPTHLPCCGGTPWAGAGALTTTATDTGRKQKKTQCSSGHTHDQCSQSKTKQKHCNHTLLEAPTYITTRAMQQALSHTNMYKSSTYEAMYVAPQHTSPSAVRLNSWPKPLSAEATNIAPAQTSQHASPNGSLDRECDPCHDHISAGVPSVVCNGQSRHKHTQMTARLHADTKQHAVEKRPRYMCVSLVLGMTKRQRDTWAASGSQQ